MTNEEIAEAEIEAVIKTIQNDCLREMNDEEQHLLAELIKVLNKARCNNEYHLISTIILGFKALSAEKPNLILTKEIINMVTLELKGGTKFSPPVRVVMGLGFLLYVAIPLISYFLPLWMDKESIFNIPKEEFLMVALFGAVGSIVSIIVRIQDFLTVDVRDNFILYFTGAFKPIIGMSFALFVYAMINSGLIPVVVKSESSTYFFMSVSFLAGFSERFARDIVGTIENKIIKATEGYTAEHEFVSLQSNKIIKETQTPKDN